MKPINIEEVANDILNAMENCVHNNCFAKGNCGECIYYDSEPMRCVPKLMKDAQGLIQHLLAERKR